MAERLKIARLGHRGDGIADTPGGPVYVPFTLPSEDVSVEDEPGHPDHRRLLKVERTSPGRIEPICPHFGVCGGCALQHWALPRQLEWKHQLVADALAQAGVDASVYPTLDAHGDGRRRVVFHARVAPGGQPAVGFMAARAHQLVAIDICPILAPGLAGALPVARALAGAIPPGKPLDIQMTATENGLDVDLRGSGSLSAKLGGALAAIADRHGLARLTRHGELIAQRQQPMLTIGRAQVALPPAAFLQATVAAEETLARLVLDYVGSARTVADLFSGVGPFALRLAGKAQVSAFDNDRAAIEALTRAAKATSGLKPVNAQARDLFRSPLAAKELDAFAAVVFDPPRQGAQAQARELAASKVPIVVAVSCDVQTFARDAKTLVEGGYRLQTVTPVDQFRYSPHVEIVAKFTR